MKKTKKILIFVLFIACLSEMAYGKAIKAVSRYGDLQLELSILRDKILLGEPFHAIAKLKNIGSKKLAILGYIENYNKTPIRYFSVEAPEPYTKDYTKRECYVLQTPTKAVETLYIEPGEEIFTDIGYEVTCSLYTTGLHKLIYRYEFPNDQNSRYANKAISYWSGKIEVSVPFNVLEPQGEDAIIFKNYLERWKNEPVDPCFCVFLSGAEKQYPSSIYVAWDNYQDIFAGEPKEVIPNIFNLNNKYYNIYHNVKEIIKRIKEKTYEGGREFNDPDEGFKEFKIEEGVEACKLVKKKSEMILKYHPDFIFADQLKIRIALCDIEIGNEAEGIKQLQDFLQQEQMKAIKEKSEVSPEGKWVEEFLKEWFAAKAAGDSSDK